MSHCLQTFSAEILEFLLKIRYFKNLKKSANNFRKKRKQYNDKTDTIDSDIDLWTKELALSKKL